MAQTKIRKEQTEFFDGTLTPQSRAGLIKLTAGQYLELWCYQNSGGNEDISGNQCQLMINKIA